MRAAMAEVAGFDGLLIVHAEDAAAIDAAPAPAVATMRPSSRPGRRPRRRPRSRRSSRPPATPVVEPACCTSPTPTPRTDRRWPPRRRQGSVETCPHYLTFAAEEIPDGATELNCSPADREAANNERLWDGLLAGNIDCVVSDHSPSTPELKRADTGDFGAAWGGVSSLQLGLPAVWTGARERGVRHSRTSSDGWPSAPRCWPDSPARAASLPAATPTSRCFAPDESWVVDPADLHHRHPVTPYAGGRCLASFDAAGYEGARPGRIPWAGC